jgi:DNA-binding PadR family transcriptional regulator
VSLPHAILTALLERPSSGHDLARRFDRSIGYFWSATHQQIYRELGRLESAGLIRALPTARPARGRRREYEVLPAGRAELTRWIGDAEDPRPIRDSLVLRLRAAAVAGPDAAAELAQELRRHRELHLAQLHEYEHIEHRDFARPAKALSQADRLQHLVLQAGIELETLWVGWLARAVEQVEVSSPSRGAGPAGSREP